MFSREFAGVIGFSAKQGPKSGIDPLDVFPSEFLLDHLVDLVQEVVHVPSAGRRMCEIEVPIRVGGADDPVVLPGDDEEHALRGAQNQAGVSMNPVSGDHQVDALGRAHLNSAATGHLLDLVGPNPGGVDDLVSAHLNLATAFEAAQVNPGDALARQGQAFDPGAAGDGGAVQGSRPHQGEGVPGIVHLGVVVLDGAFDLRAGQARKCAEGLPAAQVPVPGQVPPQAREQVVNQYPGADVGAFPDPVEEGIEERNRDHQMRTESAKH